MWGQGLTSPTGAPSPGPRHSAGPVGVGPFCNAGLRGFAVGLPAPGRGGDARRQLLAANAFIARDPQKTGCPLRAAPPRPRKEVRKWKGRTGRTARARHPPFVGPRRWTFAGEGCWWASSRRARRPLVAEGVLTFRYCVPRPAVPTDPIETAQELRGRFSAGGSRVASAAGELDELADGLRILVRPTLAADHRQMYRVHRRAPRDQAETSRAGRREDPCECSLASRRGPPIMTGETTRGWLMMTGQESYLRGPAPGRRSGRRSWQSAGWRRLRSRARCFGPARQTCGSLSQKWWPRPAPRSPVKERRT